MVPAGGDVRITLTVSQTNKQAALDLLLRVLSIQSISASARTKSSFESIIRFIDDTSYFAFTSAGRLHTMRMGVGALNVDVTRYLSTKRSQSSGSNLRCSTTV